MKRVILTGFMGSGKSTLGRELAKKMLIDFFDTDDLIEINQKISINEIFTFKGEAKFRLLEKEIVEDLSYKTDCVISVGGGLPTIDGMMPKLNGMGTTIYLKVSKDELVRRLIMDTEHRPLIVGMNKEQIESLVADRLTLREKFYEQASIVINDDELTIDKLYEIVGANH